MGVCLGHKILAVVIRCLFNPFSPISGENEIFLDINHYLFKHSSDEDKGSDH